MFGCTQPGFVGVKARVKKGVARSSFSKKREGAKRRGVGVTTIMNSLNGGGGKHVHKGKTNRKENVKAWGPAAGEGERKRQELAKTLEVCGRMIKKSRGKESWLAKGYIHLGTCDKGKKNRIKDDKTGLCVSREAKLSLGRDQKRGKRLRREKKGKITKEKAMVRPYLKKKKKCDASQTGRTTNWQKGRMEEKKKRKQAVDKALSLPKRKEEKKRRAKNARVEKVKLKPAQHTAKPKTLGERSHFCGLRRGGMRKNPGTQRWEGVKERNRLQAWTKYANLRGQETTFLDNQGGGAQGI